MKSEIIIDIKHVSEVPGALPIHIAAKKAKMCVESLRVRIRKGKQKCYRVPSGNHRFRYYVCLEDIYRKWSKDEGKSDERAKEFCKTHPITEEGIYKNWIRLLKAIMKAK